MRTSLTISFAMHSAIVVAAFVGLPAAKEFKVAKTQSIDVDIVKVSELNKLQAKSEDKKEPEKPEPKLKPEKKPEPELKPEKKKKEAKIAPPPPPPPPPAPKPPEPAVKTPPPPKLEKVEIKPEAKPEPKLEAEKKKVKPELARKPVPIPRRRPKIAQIKPKKDRKFNPNKIAALLNKLPEDDKSGASKPQKTKKKSTARKTKSKFSGKDATISADEKEFLRRQIGNCWNTPVGVKNAENLVVKIKIRLKRDGTLERPPEILSPLSSATYRVAADSAVRAIRRCGPYQLPAKKFNVWREIVLNFDPREMFGG